MSESEILLSGGNSTEVTRIGDTVHRASGKWTPSVHALLKHFEKVGFDAAPRVLGFDPQGREVLTFIEGEVGNYPLPSSFWSDAALIHAAKLLRRYHEATVSFVPPVDASWRFPTGYSGPHEVICHNDYAPYNCVYQNNLPVAIIDFDYASPGTQIWDIAHAVYRFVPICNGEEFWGKQPDFNRLNQRIQLFCDNYGLENRSNLLNVILQRLELLKQMNLEKAANTPDQAETFLHHADVYANDISYIKHLITLDIFQL